MKFKIKYHHLNLFILMLILDGLAGCKKQDAFLNAIPQNNLIVPKSLDDLLLLAHNESVFNRATDPGLGTLSGDEFYATNSLFNAAASYPYEQTGYTWAKNLYPQSNTVVPDWNYPYQQVYNANTILDNLSLVPNSDLVKANTIKGTALFFRAKAFYYLVQTFALPYDSATASITPGIPLRLNSDLEPKSSRASIQQCYDQIIKDLTDATGLLPQSAEKFTQPSVTVANGFLARVYLAMGNYQKAFEFADAFLSKFNTLTDYNSLIPVGVALSNAFLSEDIFHCTYYKPALVGSTRALIDSTVYNNYENDDLRKTLLFHDYGFGGQAFVGTYDVFGRGFFDGVATDEIYLIRAEANARLGRVDAAMADVNTLLEKRYKTGTFTSRIAVSATDAIDQILMERRKELIYRGTRWDDLRRLNKDPNYAKTLVRIVNGVTYTLPPNDPRYAMQIPDVEIQLSGIQQNLR